MATRVCDERIERLRMKIFLIGLIWFVTQRFCQLVEAEVALRYNRYVAYVVVELDIVADVLWPSKSVKSWIKCVTGVILSFVLLGCITKPQTDCVVISFAVYYGS